MKQNAAIFQDPSSFYQQNLTLYASSSPLNFIENQKKIQQNRINIKKMRRDQESRMFAVVVWRGLPTT